MFCLAVLCLSLCQLAYELASGKSYSASHNIKNLPHILTLGCTQHQGHSQLILMFKKRKEKKKKKSSK